VAATEPSGVTDWARWLQAQLDELGWRRSDLTNRAPGVNKDRLSKWLRSEEVPRLEAIRRVCAALGVPAVQGMVAAGHLRPEDVGATVLQLPDVWRPSKRELLEEIARRIPDDASVDDPPLTAELDDHRRSRPLHPRGVEGVDWAAKPLAKPRSDVRHQHD
jgi:transcriptional regulator with XRE-family HTH domain